MHARLLSLDEDAFLVVSLVGGKAKEKEEDGEQQQLDEKLPCVVNAHHGLLTILKGALLNPNQRPIIQPKLFMG